MMQKFLYILSCLAIMLSHSYLGHAQVIRGALLGGFTLTQVDGDEVYGFHKTGYTMGAAAIVPFGEKWSVSLETSFIQKGSYQKAQTRDSLSYEYRLAMDYLEVPVLVHFTDKETITVGGGFAWARLVGIKEYEHGNRVETTTLLGGPYDRSDISLIGDIRFRMYRRLHFNARYAYSLDKIRTREFKVGNETLIRDQFNNVISFRLVYVFNEFLPDRKPTTAGNNSQR